MDEQYYMIRYIKNGTVRYSCGAGRNCTPKLYTLNGARSSIRSDLKMYARWEEHAIAAGKTPPTSPIIELVPVDVIPRPPIDPGI
jgi:hypothetical protein